MFQNKSFRVIFPILFPVIIISIVLYLFPIAFGLEQTHVGQAVINFAIHHGIKVVNYNYY